MSEVLDVKSHIENPDLGIDDRKRLADSLAKIVADTYVLLVKTQGYHWNVVGPLFVSLHKLTEEQYEDLFEAGDELAERIRALGYPAPCSLHDMIKDSRVAEATGNPTAEEMVENLVADHETVVRHLREITDLAEELHDQGTADMLTDRMKSHEKAIWMLRAIVARSSAA
jgi:starvation-inducible DNA-binding protein